MIKGRRKERARHWKVLKQYSLGKKTIANVNGKRATKGSKSGIEGQKKLTGKLKAAGKRYLAGGRKPCNTA